MGYQDKIMKVLEIIQMRLIKKTVNDNIVHYNMETCNGCFKI